MAQLVWRGPSLLKAVGCENDIAGRLTNRPPAGIYKAVSTYLPFSLGACLEEIGDGWATEVGEEPDGT